VNTRFAILAASLFVLSATLPLAAQESDRPIVVCSTTQVADFTRQIVGDRWEVKCILAPGQDPHLYQITPRDAEMIASADLCLENGWHLEGKDWMRTLAADAGKPIATCITGIKPVELEDKGVTINDPHGWFTPKNAAVYVRNIAHAVSQIDPDNKEEYEARAELYLEELRALHIWIVRQCNAIPANKRILVTSHDAFNYFCGEYGFEARSPAGWSTGQEIGGGITPARKQETIESIRSFGVKAIFVETSVNPMLIEEIASEAGVKVGGTLYSDSMGGPDTAGETYIGMMRENVLTIVGALK
jgi:manganese/iron transport system substrate-binding protein